MKRSFRLYLKDDPQIVYETPLNAFSLGRSKKCDICIGDPHISRIQARVRFENGKYFLENVGRNPVFINGSSTDGQYLAHGDAVTFGTTTLIFHPEKSEDQPEAQLLEADKTVVLTSLPAGNVTPSLILAIPDGTSRAYPLGDKILTIGRSSEADIFLEDGSISRRHCSIEKREDIFFIKNLSSTNATLVNGAEVEEERLYKGDILRIGVFFLTFISEREMDLRKEENAQEARPGWGLWLSAACLLIVCGGFLFYWHAYCPWRIRQDIKSVRAQIAAGEYESAQQNLKHLLSTEAMGREKTQQIRELLAQTVLAATRQMEVDHPPAEVQDYLAAHLKDYGGGKEAKELRHLLDLYRLQTGRSLEADRQNQAALAQYGAVGEDSPHYEEAQKGIRRVWLTLQQERHKNQNLDRLLEEAEQHFSARRYLTPVNQNAYPIYQTILSLDPENGIARRRIEQMKLFYRQHGDRFFNQRSWNLALTYYERYHVIDPDSREIKERIADCRARLNQEGAPSGKPPAGEKIPDAMRDQVKSLLEKSGAESTWIMKYLFEEKSGEKD